MLTILKQLISEIELKHSKELSRDFSKPRIKKKLNP
jgi:hypothetical protein